MNPTTGEKKVKEHWYKVFMYYCPVCGDGETLRERVYGDKPKELSKRYQTKEYYDYCNG